MVSSESAPKSGPAIFWSGKSLPKERLSLRRKSGFSVLCSARKPETSRTHPSGWKTASAEELSESRFFPEKKEIVWSLVLSREFISRWHRFETQKTVTSWQDDKATRELFRRPCR